MPSISDWNRIKESEAYQRYTPEDRLAIQAQWFKENIVPTPEFQSYNNDDKASIVNSFVAEGGMGFQIGDIFGDKEGSGLIDSALDVGKSIGKQALRFGPNIARTLDQAIGFSGGLLESGAKGMTSITGLEGTFGPYERIGKAIKEYGLKGARDITKDLEHPFFNLPKEKQQKLWDNPQYLLDPEWLAYNAGEAIQSLGLVIAGSIAGGPAGAIGVGGGMEGLDLYDQLIREGTDQDKAASASIAFGIVTGILNKIGVDRVLEKTAGTFLKRAASRIIAGGTEAVTEWLEEPFQAAFGELAKGKDIKEATAAAAEALKNVDVMPGAFLAGGVMHRPSKPSVAPVPPDPTTRDQNLDQQIKQQYETGQLTIDRLTALLGSLPQDSEAYKTVQDLIAVEEAKIKPAPEPTAPAPGVPSFEPAAEGLPGAPQAAVGLREQLELEQGTAAERERESADRVTKAFQDHENWLLNEIRQSIANSSPAMEDAFIQDAIDTGARYDIDPSKVNQAIIDGWTDRGRIEDAERPGEGIEEGREPPGEARKVEAEEGREPGRGEKPVYIRQPKDEGMETEAGEVEPGAKEEAEAEREKRQAEERVKKAEEEVKPTAVFKGWQETMKGPPIPLYNVQGGKLDKSTVSRETLEKEGIEVPETPEVEVRQGEPGRIEFEGVERTPEQIQLEIYKIGQSIGKLESDKKRAVPGKRNTILSMLGNSNRKLSELRAKWEEWTKSNPGLAKDYENSQKQLSSLKPGDMVDVHYWGNLEVTKVNQKTVRAKRPSDGHEVEDLIPKTSIKFSEPTPTPEPKAEPEAKEAWEMTLDEYVKFRRGLVERYRNMPLAKAKEILKKEHKTAIESALIITGKPVTPEVLAEYPELKEKGARAAVEKEVIKKEPKPKREFTRTEEIKMQFGAMADNPDTLQAKDVAQNLSSEGLIKSAKVRGNQIHIETTDGQSHIAGGFRDEIEASNFLNLLDVKGEEKPPPKPREPRGEEIKPEVKHETLEDRIQWKKENTKRDIHAERDDASDLSKSLPKGTSLDDAYSKYVEENRDYPYFTKDEFSNIFFDWHPESVPETEREETPEPIPEVAEKEKPPSPVKLTPAQQKIKVKVKAVRRATGEQVLVEENAQDALNDIDKKLATYKRLLDCVS